MGFARFMASAAGRGLRIVTGLVLIPVGPLVVHGTLGIVVCLFGVVALAAGAFNFCLLGPLLGAPFRGADLK